MSLFICVIFSVEKLELLIKLLFFGLGLAGSVDLRATSELLLLLCHSSMIFPVSYSIVRFLLSRPSSAMANPEYDLEDSPVE